MRHIVRLLGGDHSRAGRRVYVALLVLLVLAVHASLVWLAIGSERRELTNRLFMQTRDASRLAIARIDSALMPLLVAESARPSTHFDAFAPQAGAIDIEGLPLPSGEVLVPSPLLGSELPLRNVHFTWSAAEGLRSPQVIRSALREHAAALAPDVKDVLERAADKLKELGTQVTPDDWQRLLDTTALAPSPLLTGLPRAAAPTPPPGMPVSLARRLAGGADDGQAARLGMRAHFLPRLDGSGHTLVLLRRAELNEIVRLEGVWIEWTRLRGLVLDEVADVVRGRRVMLLPLAEAPRARTDERLAALPAAVIVGDLEWPPPLGWSETRRALAVASAVVLAALALGAWALFAAWELGERRARFASGVTHELRTPLTTFQLYSELLANDRIKDPERRRAALETLRNESARLARVVENVLSQARLERGSAQIARTPIDLAAVLERAQPGLARRAQEAGLALVLPPVAGVPAPVLGDGGAIEQILVNLVDNAAKYAEPSALPTVELTVEFGARKVSIRVRDHGPGVRKEREKQLFAPFARGGAEPHVQGLGLGLSLSRELARSMGGELCLEPRGGADSRGASFRLELPTAPSV